MGEKNQQNNIKNRYLQTVEHINWLCACYDRNPQSVKLVVVTKGHSVEDVRKVISAGASFLGENYVEETTQKKVKLADVAEQVEWHMIGHIQSRKAKLIPDLYDQIHSIDRIKTARKINQQLLQENKKMSVLLQYNVGGEEQKYGWQADDEKTWSSLLPNFLEILSFSQLCVKGLMTMPPLSTGKKEALMAFQKLQRLRDYFQANVQGLELSELSMGTSHDYEAAIQAGATYIRIGTAIMGERSYNK